MKKIELLFILLTIVIIPFGVNAKSYNFPADFQSILYDSENPQNVVELLPGDEIVFTYRQYHSNSFTIYIDDEKQSNCYGVSCSTDTYNVTKKMYFSYGLEYPEELYFITQNEIKKSIYTYNNSNKYYKSGDFIIFKNISYNGNGLFPRVYDTNDSLIKEYNLYYGFFSMWFTFENNMHPGNYLLLKLPKIDDKEVYWKQLIFNDGNYGYPNPHYIPIEYTEPKLELRCDKDKLNYGEKTSCELCMTSYYNMRNISFSFNNSQLKISNIQLSDNIQNNGDGNNIVLAINQPTDSGEEIVLMRFEVEGAIEDSYLDSVELDNIEYEDDVIKGNYDSLNSQIDIISVKSNTITNPETGVKGLFIILPLFLLLVSMIINQRIKKETTN